MNFFTGKTRVVQKAPPIHGAHKRRSGGIPLDFIDNYPESTVQRKPQRKEDSQPVTERANPQKISSLSRKKIVHRMVVATAPVGGIDRIIAADIAFQNKRAGGQTLTLANIEQSTDGKYAIQNGEWIIVCGHGNGSTMDKISPESLSAAMQKIRNIGKVGGIYLSACKTATVDKEGNSFLENFGRDLMGPHTEGHPWIIGATGYKINDFDEVSGERQVAVSLDKGAEATKIQNELWGSSGMIGNIKKPLNLSSIDEVLAAGKVLLEDPKFREFFKNFVGSLQKAQLLEKDQLRSRDGESINLI